MTEKKIFCWAIVFGGGITGLKLSGNVHYTKEQAMEHCGLHNILNIQTGVLYDCEGELYYD